MELKPVGILGYQGCIEPHEVLLRQINIPSIRVTKPEHLAQVDRLIIPGGESTTMLKFLQLHSMVSPILEFARKHPVWGICAGAILVASEVASPTQESLKLIEIAAHRNFYGSQLDSFTTTLAVDILDKPIQAHFIRAPLLSKLSKTSSSNPPVLIHSYHKDQPVFFSQGRIWACSFHVELGRDPLLHQKFVEL